MFFVCLYMRVYSICVYSICKFYESICTCNQHHPQKVFVWSRYWSPYSPTSQSLNVFPEILMYCRWWLDSILCIFLEGGSSITLERAFLCTILGIFRWSCCRFVKAPCQLSHFLHLGGSLLDLDVRCELFDNKTLRPEYQPLTYRLVVKGTKTTWTLWLLNDDAIWLFTQYW